MECKLVRIKTFHMMNSNINFKLIFVEKEARLRLNRVGEDWTQYMNDQYVFKTYDLNELIKVVSGRKIDGRYSRLLRIWETSIEGREILATAARQRIDLDLATAGQNRR